MPGGPCSARTGSRQTTGSAHCGTGGARATAGCPSVRPPGRSPCSGVVRAPRHALGQLWEGGAELGGKVLAQERLVVHARRLRRRWAPQRRQHLVALHEVEHVRQQLRMQLERCRHANNKRNRNKTGTKPKENRKKTKAKGQCVRDVARRDRTEKSGCARVRGGGVALRDRTGTGRQSYLTCARGRSGRRRGPRRWGGRTAGRTRRRLPGRWRSIGGRCSGKEGHDNND